MSELLHLRYAEGAADMDTVRTLFREYQQGLGVSLCFQDFDAELAGLPGKYAGPQGCILLAEADGRPAGVVALRSLDGDTVAEMKRLYVRPAARGLGLGRRLAASIVDEARKRGYARMRLDTLPKLSEAIALYATMGFVEIAPYYGNPLPGVRFYELKL
ncbi:MAG: GNAT family N-acetyltransferase [Rhodospirillales bacterium]|nr:GNAT family N-acetyltransferase [Rhodospirillales bacterium]